MKKLMYISIAIILCTALLAACGDTTGDDGTASPSPAATESAQASATPAPTPTPVPTPTATPVATPTATPTTEPTEAPSESAEASGFTVLKLESEGDAVTELQERLEKLGYLDKVTGYFGTDTEAAVKAFQKNNDLTEDGKVGQATLDAVMSEDAVEAS